MSDQAWIDHAPDGYIYTANRWASLSTAPRVRWSIPATVPRQRVFIGILRADGQSDFEIPISSITIRLRDVSASYIGCTIPNPETYTDDILARIPGRIHVFVGELFGEFRQVEELFYGNIQNLYFNRGNTNTLTIVATRFITHRNPVERQVEKVSKLSKDETGKYKIRCAIDFFIKPTDIATYGDSSFAINLISYTINAHDTFMEIEGE